MNWTRCWGRGLSRSGQQNRWWRWWGRAMPRRWGRGWRRGWRRTSPAERGKILRKAAGDYPDHHQLQAFADSASVLYDPDMLQQSGVSGPLGLTLLTDLSPAQFVPVLEKLKPYIEKFRLWLPNLADKLEGRIAIFSGPVAYLRAALLVAGDNLDNVAGMYLSHGIKGDATVMACRAFGEDELLRTIVHELWHLALASTGAERAVPRWLNEGMAVFLSAGRVESGVMRYDTLPSEFEGFLNAPPEVAELPANKGIEAVAVSPGGDLVLIAEVIGDPVRGQALWGVAAAIAGGSVAVFAPGVLRENYASAWAVALYFATENATVQQLRAMLTGDPEALGAVNAQRLSKGISEAVNNILKD